MRTLTAAALWLGIVAGSAQAQVQEEAVYLLRTPVEVREVPLDPARAKEQDRAGRALDERLKAALEGHARALEAAGLERVSGARRGLETGPETGPAGARVTSQRMWAETLFVGPAAPQPALAGLPRGTELTALPPVALVVTTWEDGRQVGESQPLYVAPRELARAAGSPWKTADTRFGALLRHLHAEAVPDAGRAGDLRPSIEVRGQLPGGELSPALGSLPGVDMLLGRHAFGLRPGLEQITPREAASNLRLRRERALVGASPAPGRAPTEGMTRRLGG